MALILRYAMKYDEFRKIVENVKEAVKIAESLQKDAPNVQFYIVPKMFNPSNALGEDVDEELLKTNFERASEQNNKE